ARLYAEDPGRDFQPSPGLLTAVQFPPADGQALRIDTWVEAGCEIPPYFDPMIAKVITWATTRAAASAALDQALADTVLYGVESNRNYLRQILVDAPFASGNPWTRCLDGLNYQASTLEVLSAGTQTSVQDFPGRLGYWAVGVPPSGPMDDRALRLGNRLLGNAQGVAALEITMSGPTLRFNTDAVVAVTGAPIPLSVDGIEQPRNTALMVKAGSTLSLGTIQGAGARSYLCLRGGLQVPDYLGSKSTFTLGQFGGHGGRALRAGDVLHLLPLADSSAGASLPAELCDALPAERAIRVIYGPHGAPEYFTPRYIATFFATAWEVHFNSSRTGVRLIGPKPEWVRDSGGEAGLHPSNIHDNPYAIGAVDFTGDMPVILGPDGPSLGGFVCPVTIIEADLWQLGQLKAGDKVRFVPVDVAMARALAKANNLECASLCRSQLAVVRHSDDPASSLIASKGYGAPLAPTQAHTLTSPIVLDIGHADKRLVARLSGDTHLLLEIGAAELNLVLRFRGHALMQALEAKQLVGVIDLTPGIRSLQLHYQPETLALNDLLGIVAGEWDAVCAAQDLKVPSRIVHLPLSWDDPACQLAIDKYMTTVRKDAPWCPSNLEFIRRINDLPDLDEVYRTVFEASYLVMGLGDVYLGAPVATPLDPRHRLVTTKYNPARTWTAENSVGIGGAYMCVYGMEGPGGYQFVGRTL
ncbi:MAG: 5-oxoprolinase/urea amidolyase family protein, partial [Pseudomonas sp.]|uniref:5-oxoprolinase/urea amidolyase family protein n=1 Tax=Pseudomonas sp. TaxID=306 RepID=UPI003BB516A9